MEDRTRRLRSWWPVLLIIFAMAIVAFLLLRSDDELHTAFTELAHAQDFPDDLAADTAMRVLSPDPFVVEEFRFGIFGVKDSRYVHTSLRPEIEGLKFGDYILAAVATVELPCDCGPDESLPIQPVVFAIQVVSRGQAETHVPEDANTSGIALRLSVAEGTLVVFRDGEVLFRADEGDDRTLYGDRVGVEVVEAILDAIDRDAIEKHSRMMWARGGLQLMDSGYQYVPFGEYVERDLPAELEPLVADLLELADRVVAEGEKVVPSES